MRICFESRYKRSVLFVQRDVRVSEKCEALLLRKKKFRKYNGTTHKLTQVVCTAKKNGIVVDTLILARDTFVSLFVANIANPKL